MIGYEAWQARERERGMAKALGAVGVVLVAIIGGSIAGFIFVTLLNFLTAGVARAQSPATSAPSAGVVRTDDPAVRAILDRHLRASGGDRPLPHQHLVLEITSPGARPIRAEIWLSLPDKVLSRTTVDGAPMLEFGFDGTVGWSSSPATGLERLSREAVTAMRQGLDPGSSATFDSTAVLSAVGRTTFEGETVDAVRAVTAAGDTSVAYYSVATGLLAGAHLPMRAAGRTLEGTMVFRDYARTGHQQQPRTVVMRMKGIEAVTRVVVAEDGVIDPVRFRAPAGLPPGSYR